MVNNDSRINQLIETLTHRVLTIETIIANLPTIEQSENLRVGYIGESFYLNRVLLFLKHESCTYIKAVSFLAGFEYFDDFNAANFCVNRSLNFLVKGIYELKSFSKSELLSLTYADAPATT